MRDDPRGVQTRRTFWKWHGRIRLDVVATAPQKISVRGRRSAHSLWSRSASTCFLQSESRLRRMAMPRSCRDVLHVRCTTHLTRLPQPRGIARARSTCLNQRVFVERTLREETHPDEKAQIGFVPARSEVLLTHFQQEHRWRAE